MSKPKRTPVTKHERKRDERDPAAPSLSCVFEKEHNQRDQRQDP